MITSSSLQLVYSQLDVMSRVVLVSVPIKIDATFIKPRASGYWKRTADLAVY